MHCKAARPSLSAVKVTLDTKFCTVFTINLNLLSLALALSPSLSSSVKLIITVSLRILVISKIFKRLKTASYFLRSLSLTNAFKLTGLLT